MTVDEIYSSLATWSVFSDSEDLPMACRKVSVEAIFVRLLEISFFFFNYMRTIGLSRIIQQA